MRCMLIYIIRENVKKAWLIQSGVKEITQINIKEMYHELDFRSILQIQSESCHDSKSGFIWILNTCITFCGEYKFMWK